MSPSSLTGPKFKKVVDTIYSTILSASEGYLSEMISPHGEIRPAVMLNVGKQHLPYVTEPRIIIIANVVEYDADISSPVCFPVIIIEAEYVGMKGTTVAAFKQARKDFNDICTSIRALELRIKDIDPKMKVEFNQREPRHFDTTEDLEMYVTQHGRISDGSFAGKMGIFISNVQCKRAMLELYTQMLNEAFEIGNIDPKD